MLDFLTKLFRPSPRKPHRRLRRGFRPLVEALEDRLTPAGNIDVTFLAGSLKIVGDANDQTLYITQQADGRLTLNTDIATGMKLNGQVVSGFQGVTLPTQVGAGVTINMGGGNDFLTLTGNLAD